MYFKKRLPEPKEMDKLDFRVFNKLSSDKYSVWFIPLTDSIVDMLGDKKAVILDLACGTGFLAKELHKRSNKFDIFCLDNSRHAINLAKKNCKGVKNIHFKIGSVEKIPYKDSKFDLIVCKDSFHHFSSAIRSLREIIRVLKSNGILYIQDLRRDLPDYFIKQTLPLDNPIKKLQYYSVRASYTKSEITSLVNKFHPKYLKVFTRILSPKIKKKYLRKGINLDQLKSSFQSRYILILKK